MEVCDPRKAPKRKGPWLDDNGTAIPDSTFIRWHLEREHGIDFDAGLSGDQKSLGWALEKMCEDHLYFSMLWERWEIDENFTKGPSQFFGIIPAVVRGFLANRIRKSVTRDLDGQGFSRHSHDEIAQLVIPDLDTLSNVLGDKPWLFGDTPCGADAAVHGFVTNVLCEHFQTPVQESGVQRANLVAFRDRGLAEWFPEGK